MAGLCCAAGECSSPDCIQLTQRELAVCQTICESGVPVGFSEIKRVVGLHQEITSRILKRLLNHGAIEKRGGKYGCKTGQ
jgi:DNA-binding IclR family transcriptional regulator